MKRINLGILSVFIDSIHFLNNSLESLVKILGENDFYHLQQEFEASLSDIFRKK